MSQEVRLVPPVTEERQDISGAGEMGSSWMGSFSPGETGPWSGCSNSQKGGIHFLWICRGAFTGIVVRSFKKTPAGWTVISAGPTASTRFSLAEIRAIEQFGVRLIVGKGGMFPESREAMKKKGAAFLASVGGAASFYARQIVRVKEVHWLDLGLRRQSGCWR